MASLKAAEIDLIKETVTKGPKVKMSYLLSSLLALKDGKNDLSIAYSECGMHVAALVSQSTLMLEMHERIEALERQVADLEADLAVATGKMTALVV